MPERPDPRPTALVGPPAGCTPFGAPCDRLRRQEEQLLPADPARFRRLPSGSGYSEVRGLSTESDLMAVAGILPSF